MPETKPPRTTPPRTTQSRTTGAGTAILDAVVVGAGPAGSAAALALARAGRSVVLVERGLFPGSKNVYGGVVYGRVLDALIPGWWEEVPVERWVVRRSTMMMTADQSLSVDYRSQAWGSAPYNGMTTYRADFDSWLAGKAVEAGAQLVTSTVATGLLRDPAGRVVGVRTDRPDGDLPAKLVVACDGVNSFLAKEAGLLPRAEADHHTLGVKEVLGLPAEVINDRFGLQSHEGLDIEMVGCTRGIPGGGFLYTNADSVAVGVVLSLPDLAKSGVRPEEIITDLKAHPSIAPYLRGADVKEYAAHLIPEGGYDTMPKLAMDGMLIAGDAAAMTLAAGIWLEGVNFAIGSGYAAGRAADRAIAAGDVSELGLASYRADLEGQFVLADHKRLRRAPALVLSDRIQHRYPGMVCDLVESMFTVTNPTPKPGAVRLARRAAAHHGVKLWELASDTIRAARIFG
ncbi:MAG TPA: FAD-dependent oxidoreductase [Acidimicrobiales bacterium]|jgi:electron transfer flavoprotein-quinone oxidoreductase|nr:FAD-dependent oxidoreductase [Acidimicrobiales bacterium]